MWPSGSRGCRASPTRSRSPGGRAGFGVEPPARAKRWRAIHAELERMANHLDVIAKQAETTALSVGQARFQILKEQVMRLRAQADGSRFARGTLIPGGVRAECSSRPAELLTGLDAIERDLRATASCSSARPRWPTG